MGYKPERISEIVKGIQTNKYLLPAIQREMVWDSEQIEKLFDSILSRYPIGSMLFWKYTKSKDSQYKFYEFLKHYDEYTLNHNQEYNLNGKDDIIGVLDGQQRLTSLYIGLKGYMNIHKPRTQWKNSENFEKKFLYINVLHTKNNEDEDEDTKLNYEFKFKSLKEIAKENKDGKKLWFAVGEILNFKNEYDYENLEIYKQVTALENKDIEKTVEKTFKALFYEFVKNENIYFYEEIDDSFDKVLQIFIRVNSGGTPLDYTDFLMSMIINQWGEGREEINKSIDNINNECDFEIPKDIFLRGCLFMTDSSLRFNADNFKQTTITKIKEQFENIVRYVKASCSIFKQLGYTKNNLRSNLIILPLAYYLKEKNIIEIRDLDELAKVKRWIQLSILNKVFGSQTTSYLAKLRKLIKGSNFFPLENIISESNLMGRNMSMNIEQLEDLIENAKYSTQNSWALLTLLYPSNNYEDCIFHEDHIYPRSRQNKYQMENGGNYLINLQLLRDNKNISKSDKNPEEWLKLIFKDNKDAIKEYKKYNYIPDIELSDEKFNEFIEKRKKLILKKLSEELNIKTNS